MSVTPISRRHLLSMIGLAAGSTAMYGAMTAMGFAQQSQFAGFPRLDAAPEGASVVILGAGLAGMTAALELRQAGYEVTVLEYQGRAGGRCMTLRGGDTVREMGGGSYTVGFSEGQYLNNGPWRIPHHHAALLAYCTRLGVALEPFIQENQNALLHNPETFGPDPVTFREINTDWLGHVSELLAKATDQGALDGIAGLEDREALAEALREFGILDENMEYTRNPATADYRGYARAPGGGIGARPEPSDPIPLERISESGFWSRLREHNSFVHQAPMFQPVGGMDRIARGFEAEVGDLITYNAKVTRIAQSDDGVTVEYDPADGTGTGGQLTADYCICTIPFSVLGQLQADLSGDLAAAVGTMWYHGAFKAGLEMKRRFWEQDHAIYGGISYTSLPIDQISYPSQDLFSDGPGVLLGGYVFGSRGYQFNSMTPEERVQTALRYGREIHPEYDEEFVTGVGYSWHRNPTVLGCYGAWRDRSLYEGAVRMDRRLVCAGEHLSYLPGWQEGAILSALSAVEQLHERAKQG